MDVPSVTISTLFLGRNGGPAELYLFRGEARRYAKRSHYPVTSRQSIPELFLATGYWLLVTAVKKPRRPSPCGRRRSVPPEVRLHPAPAFGVQRRRGILSLPEIGRASCRERV